jgi:hypothetical protein
MGLERWGCDENLKLCGKIGANRFKFQGLPFSEPPDFATDEINYHVGARTSLKLPAHISTWFLLVHRVVVIPHNAEGSDLVQPVFNLQASN